jgi:hypothetical protein
MAMLHACETHVQLHECFGNVTSEGIDRAAEVTHGILDGILQGILQQKNTNENHKKETQNQMRSDGIYSRHLADQDQHIPVIEYAEESERMPKSTQELSKGAAMIKVLRGEGMSTAYAEQLSSTILNVDWKTDPGFYDVLTNIMAKATVKPKQPSLPKTPTSGPANPEKIKRNMQRIIRFVSNRSDGKNRTTPHIKYTQTVLEGIMKLPPEIPDQNVQTETEIVTQLREEMR